MALLPPTLMRWQLAEAGAQHLEFVDAPMPTPRGREVLVRVDAVSLNYRDQMVIDNQYGMGGAHPFTPGSDMAGQVVATGPDVTRWQNGQAVISTFTAGWLDGQAPAGAMPLGLPGPGMLASHVLVHEDWLVAAPTTLEAAAASTLPCAGLTAWMALVENGGLRAGQTVLVHGTGGVALFGVQIARLHGAQAYVTSGSPEKAPAVLALGAAQVLPRSGPWPAELLRLTGGRGVDHVLETAGGATLGQSLQAVAQGGHVAYIGVMEGAGFSGSGFDLISKRARVQGVSVGHRRALQDLVRAVDAGGLQPVVAAQYPAAALHDALAHLGRGPLGKVVVTFSR